jgi:hypothetical protein
MRNGKPLRFASRVDLSFDTMSGTATGGAPRTPSDYFGQLHLQCQAVFAQSLTEPNLTQIAKSHRFAPELALWCAQIGSKREVELFRVAEHEYKYSLLSDRDLVRTLKFSGAVCGPSGVH